MSSIGLIIPVFNKKRYIPRLLDSILNQSRFFDEIIFVDDSSSDESLSVILAWQQRHRDIMTIVVAKHDSNLGVSTARNTGISLAKSDYLYFFDADDYLHESCCETIKYHIRNEPEKKMFIFQVFDQATSRRRPILNFIKNFEGRGCNLADWQEVMAKESLFCSGGNVVISSSLTSRFNPNSRHAEDWEFYILAALEIEKEGICPYYVPKVVATYTDDDHESASRTRQVPDSLLTLPAAARLPGLTPNLRHKIVSTWAVDIFDRCSLPLALTLLKKARSELPELDYTHLALTKLVIASTLGVKRARRIKSWIQQLISR